MLFPELTKPELVKLNSCVKECVDSVMREEGEKVFRKDVADRVQEEFGIKKSVFNKLVSERFLEKSNEQIAKLEELIEFNEQLILAAKNVSVISPEDDESES